MWLNILNQLIVFSRHVHKHLHTDLNPLSCCSEGKKEKAFFFFFLFVPHVIFPDGIKIEFKPASTCVDSGGFFAQFIFEFSHKRFTSYRSSIWTKKNIKIQMMK